MYVWHAQLTGYSQFIFQTFRILCGEWVEQVRSPRNGIGANENLSNLVLDPLLRRITSGDAILLSWPRPSTRSGWIIFTHWLASSCTGNWGLHEMSGMYLIVSQGLSSSVLGVCYCIYRVVDCDIQTALQKWFQITSIVIINGKQVLEGKDFR